MALSRATEATLNLSQDVRSSSPHAIEYVQVQHSVEMIEDSIKDIDAAYRGGPVQSPTHSDRRHADWDDLYDVTPGAKTTYDDSEDLTGNAPFQKIAQMPRSPDGYLKDGKTNAVDAAEKHPDRHISLSPGQVDDSLGGVTGTHPLGSRTTDGAFTTAAEKETSHSLAPLEPPAKNSDPAVAKTSTHPHQTVVAQRSQAKPLQETASVSPKGAKGTPKALNRIPPKPATGTAVSSLAMLQARRNGADITKTKSSYQAREKPSTLGNDKPEPTQKTSANVDGRRGGSKINSGSQPKQSNKKKAPVSQSAPWPTTRNTYQTPGRKSENDAASSGKPQMSGKPQSTKPRGLDQTSAQRLPVPQGRLIRESDLEYDPISDDDNTDVDHPTDHKKRSAATRKKGPLKRSANVEDLDFLEQNTTANVPNHPSRFNGPPARKKVRHSDPQKEGAVSDTTTQTPTQSPERPVKGRNSASDARSRHRRDQTQAQARKVGDVNARPNVRTRGMALTEAISQEVTAPQLTQNTETGTAAAQSAEAIQSAIQRTYDNEESLEVFGDYVVNYQAVLDEKVDRGTATGGPIVDEDVPEATTLSNENKGFGNDNQKIVESSQKQKIVPQHQVGSQDDPILLSDGEESTSSPRSGPPPSREAGQAAFSEHEKIAPKLAAVPTTPRVYQSSPPRSGHPTASDRRAVVDGSAAPRPNIINFDKHGPRNQGLSSARKDHGGSEARDRSSIPSFSKPMASDASSRQKLESKRTSAPSAILTNVESAKKGQAAPMSNTTENVVDALAEFMKRPQRKSNDEARRTFFATAGTQNAHGPQPSVTAAYHVGFGDVDDFDDRVVVTDETLPLAHYMLKSKTQLTDSQKAMPAPARKPQKGSKSSHRGPTVPSMARGPDSQSHEKSIENASRMASLKRPRDKHVETFEPPKKKQRIPKNQYEALGSAEDSKFAETGENIMTAEQPKPPVRVQSMNIIPKPPIPTSRKPSRVPSQGSQKVDMHGSPVPDGMTVPDTSTVLETFAFQAERSSNGEDPRLFMLHQAAAPFETIFSRPDFVPTSHQPKRLSSNSKPLPAAPQEESQAISRYAKADIYGSEAQSFLRENPINRFKSSSEDSVQQWTTWNSRFIQQLRNQTAGSQFRTKATPHVTSEEADPDKTLVGYERASRGFDNMRSFSSSSASSKSSPDSEDSACEYGDDLYIWHNALQPHQLNLFDELVTVSHRLVQHLVDRETAAANMVQDYHKRGLQLVQRIKRSHTEQFVQLNKTLRERKEVLREAFKQQMERLKECRKSFYEAYGEEQQPEISEEKLQSVMAEYC